MKFVTAYLSQPETNVFVVDWSKLSKLPCYPTAAYNTKQAGECTATFLLGLQANHPEFESQNIHAIGFSLGAHVLSFTSNALENAIGSKIKRITGMCLYLLNITAYLHSHFSILLLDQQNR